MRLRYLVNPLLAVVIGLASSLAASVQAEPSAAPVRQAAPTRVPIVVALQPGDRLAVTCIGGVLGSTTAAGTPIALCDAVTPTRTATRTPNPTRTATAQPSLTPSSTATTAPSATIAPSATMAQSSTSTSAPTNTPIPSDTAMPMPTATPGSGAALYESVAVNPVILGTCTAAIHDRYVATGPDGRLYRTWHPQTVLVDPANPALGTCTFAHEHGADPATSAIPNADPIVFDYISRISELDGMLMPEPHEGFKVHVVNAGQINDEDRVSQVTALILFHQGTGGPRRFTVSHHTLHVQAIMPGGQRVNVRGMADTGIAGSICARDRHELPIGRTVMTLPNVPEAANADVACVVGSPYEIWSFSLPIYSNLNDPLLTFNASLAAFDPITVMDPRDTSLAIYTGDVFPPSLGAPFADVNQWRGCNREFYVGGVVLRNAAGTAFWTNSHGQITSTGTAATALRQTFPRGNMFVPSDPTYAWQTLSLRGTEAINVFKLRQPTCAPGLGTKN